MLTFEVEFLCGTAFAAEGPESSVPDWPPQPDRIFSALVATWAARGKQKPEEDALKWLEKQPVPVISASPAEARIAPISFVPPNDPKSGRSGDKTVLPAYRRRQPRRFPAARPHYPVVRFHWDTETLDDATLEALVRLAADTAYVGHSSSLTRCLFLRGDGVPTTGVQASKRRVYEGRFDELCRDYEQFVRTRGKVGRPHPGDYAAPCQIISEETAHSCFSPKWLVLEHVNGAMPDIRAAALVAKEIRDTLLSGYGIGNAIPSEVSGHEPDGSPARAPHLAIVPMAVAGYPYADGHVLGFALVPPRNSTLFEDEGFRKALRKITAIDEDENRRVLRLEAKNAISLRSFGLKLALTSQLSMERTSLRAARYARASRRFATVTPIVLDRHLKRDGMERQEEIALQIKTALHNIGVNEELVDVVPDRHPAVEGSPSAYPSGKAPAWMGWQLPDTLASRRLTHAVIEFARPIAGPLIVGAGRFVGMGLCLPIDDAGSRQ